MSNKPTYTIECECNNCDFSGPVEIEKGTVAALGNIVCPNCGCRHLKKKVKTTTKQDWVTPHYPYRYECPPIVITPDPLPPANPDYSPERWPKVWCQNSATPVNAHISMQREELSALGKAPSLHGGLMGVIFENALADYLDK
jgi:hypothetical protein